MFLLSFQLSSIIFFKNSMVEKTARDVDFQAAGGHESLWTTDEKIEFSRVHCEVTKQLNLDFSFRGP
jgi:hypothetical protein